MKRNRMAMLLLAAMAVVAGRAQSNIESAIGMLQKNVHVKVSTDISKNPKTMQLVSSETEYNFALPSKEKGLLAKLQQAFDADADKAYSINRGTEGSTGRKTGNKVIGRDFNNFTLLCFIDPTNEEYRWAYALQWEPKGGSDTDVVKGRFTKVYGKRPKGASTFMAWPADNIFLQNDSLFVIPQDMKEKGKELKKDLQELQKKLQEWRKKKKD